MSQEPTTASITAHAQALLTEMFNIDTTKLQPDASLTEDLDLDSIDTIDLLSKLNDDFSLDLSPFDFEGCTKLGQFLERLEECQKTPQ